MEKCKRVIFLKKLVALIFSLAVLLVYPSCEAAIPQDFYLDGDVKEAAGFSRILPNTLRAELFEGESVEVFAELFPGETQNESFIWELKQKNGVVSIYPNRERCTLLANREGSETIVIRLSGTSVSESAEIDVVVLKKPEIRQRSFEEENVKSEESKVLLEKAFSAIIYGLITIAIALLGAVMIFLIKKGRRDK